MILEIHEKDQDHKIPEELPQVQKLGYQNLRSQWLIQTGSCNIIQRHVYSLSFMSIRNVQCMWYMWYGRVMNRITIYNQILQSSSSKFYLGLLCKKRHAICMQCPWLTHPFCLSFISITCHPSLRLSKDCCHIFFNFLVSMKEQWSSLCPPQDSLADFEPVSFCLNPTYFNSLLSWIKWRVFPMCVTLTSLTKGHI